MKNLQVFLLNFILSFAFSSIILTNIQKNTKYAEGDLFATIFNESLVIKVDKLGFEWLKTNSIKFCWNFFKISTFYASVEMYMKSESMESASFVDYEKCCKL